MSTQVNKSMSLANPTPPLLDSIQKVAVAIGSLGLLILVLFWTGGLGEDQSMWFWSSMGLMTLGTIIFAWRAYMPKPEGIKNDGVWLSKFTNGGIWGWAAGIVITGFYILLYWFEGVLGYNAAGNTGLVSLFDPLSMMLKGVPASQWFMYGTLYTIAILIFGFKFILKYRHNTYQIVRTISVMFFQLGFAFLIPEILEALNPESGAAWYDKDLKNMWPLDYDFFHAWHIQNMSTGGSIGMIMLIWGLLMFLFISPILTYFYGKRWYCSWVCGCGGLAETAGDPFRQLSDKSIKAWKIERWMIHSVLVFVLIMTVAVLFSFFHDNQGSYIVSKSMFGWGSVALFVLSAGFIYSQRNKSLKEVKPLIIKLGVGVFAVVALLTIVAMLTGSRSVFFIGSYQLEKWYGFFIGAAFSGVVGVGFYPIMGSRVWCRFGCPMAAILGLQQKFFSRFRITTNGGQCISCGNCSTYCEMGIDVRAYAQKGQNIVRASCVGCGICAAVCPRGVLRLENGTVDIGERTTEMRAIHITEDQIKILS